MGTPVHNEKKQLHESRNTDNVIVRNVIGGVLNVLNNKLIYNQVWGPEDTEEVVVPFFYNLGTNDERLIQDNFMFFQDVCEWPSKIDGNYDSFPRGYITLNSSSIEAASICNRFVLGEYTRKEGDVYNKYVAFLYALPIKYSFTADIICDTHITMLKLEQAIRECFYKNKTFFVLYDGLKLRCRLGLEDSTTHAAPIEHKMATDYGENSMPKLTFTFSVSTYHPIFDKSTEVRADSYIKDIAYDVHFLDKSDEITVGKRDENNVPYIASNYYANAKNGSNLYFDLSSKQYENGVFSSEEILNLNWNYNKPNGDMRSIILSELDSETGELTVLKNLKNNGYIDLDLSEIFQSDLQDQFEIEFSSPNDYLVYQLPKFAIIPDLETKYVKNSSFRIIDPGYIVDPRKCQLDFTLTYNGKQYTGKVNIEDGQVSDTLPVILDKPFKYKGDLKFKNFVLTICDAEETISNDKIKNITVV